MHTEAVRVVLVVPAIPGLYPPLPDSKLSVAGTARRAFEVAQWLVPGAGLDIVMYGKGARETAVVRSSVGSHKELAEWIKDWAVRSTGLEPEPNALERTFSMSNILHGAAVPKGVAAADAWVGEVDGTTLVICWVVDATEPANLVRIINTAGRTTVFWQFFGSPGESEVNRWTRDGLDRGRLLPYVRFRFGSSWGKRRITRGLRHWLRRREA